MKFSTYAVAQFNLVADNPQRIEIVGKAIFYRSGSAEILIRLGSPSNPAIPLREGERLECSGFDLLEIESTSTQNVDLIISPDDIKIEGINVVGIMAVKPGSVISAREDVEAVAEDKTSLVTQNAARKEVHVVSLVTNTSEIRVGNFGDVAVNAGIPLQPGQDVWIETEGALWIYNPDTSSQYVAVTENLK